MGDTVSSGSQKVYWGNFRGSLDRLVFFCDSNAMATTTNIKLIIVLLGRLDGSVG